MNLADHATRAFRIALAVNPNHNNNDHRARETRARLARTLALILGIDPVTVVATQDPNLPRLGHLFTVTDGDTTYQFVPAIEHEGIFYLLGPCPECGAEVPIAEITQLADLGQHLAGHAPPPTEFNDHRWDPNHHPTCTHMD